MAREYPAALLNVETKRFNWQIWAGFLLTFAASLSHPFIFVRWPITRDFPWVTILLFGVAAILLFIGVRRAFASGRSRFAKVVGVILTALSVVFMGLFLFSVLVMARWLPASSGAPQVGQKAPDFSLSDSTGKTTNLAELLSVPISGAQYVSQTRGVLLIFYRGYW
ncbi:MAG TPA: hypothetical protein VJS64_20410 [Pyrinomonadaceae bacterium]|nr:hypothetical protein [Pyrinomonadaceae bacterium]